MKKFNRKEAIELLLTTDLKKDFQKKLVPINSGWVVIWKGVPMKPRYGNNDYYASYEAAIQALERNSQMSREVREFLAIKLYGVNFDSPEWKNLFRYDLRYTVREMRENLTEEEERLKNEVWEVENKFTSFCYGALKTVLIKEWLKDGTLEIKKV